MNDRFNKFDFFTGIGICVLGIIIFLLTINMPKANLGLSPRDYPRIIAIGLVITGLILSIQSIVLKEEKKADYSFKKLAKIAVFLAIIFIYLYLLRKIGFLILTPLLLFSGMIIYGYRKIFFNIIISILFTLLVYLTFEIFLHVPLPKFTLF